MSDPVPNGWESEQLANNCISYKRPGGGFVTVDFSRRMFSLGHGQPRRHDGTAVYVGTRWRDRIIRDAIEHLERTMNKETV